MTFTALICANGLCSKPVRKKRGPGPDPKYCSMRCRTRANTRAYYQRERDAERGECPEPIPMATVCKNRGCGRPVPPTRGTTPRLYCSARCRTQHNAREHYYREVGKGDTMLATDESGEPFVRRYRARDHKGAKTAYQNHLTKCEIADGGKCPARFDPYDTKRECLIHAVLREDWDEQRREEVQGVKWERQLTTNTGYWKIPSI